MTIGPKRNAASLMGKAGRGPSKARTNAQAAARARWDKERKRKVAPS